MDHPVNRRGGGHRFAEDPLPLQEDQIWRYAQRPALVAFGDEGKEDLGLLGTLGQAPQVVQEQENVAGAYLVLVLHRTPRG